MSEVHRYKAIDQQALALHYLFSGAFNRVLFSGGIGAGKSTTGSHFSVDRILNNPQTIGLICANTYKQLHQSTLPCLFEFLRKYSIPYVINKMPPKSWGYESRFELHNGIMSFPNGAQVVLRSLENYDDIRGAQYGWAWLDETRDTAKEAWDVVQGRMREPHANMDYPILLTSTPNGFDWLYEEFHVKPGTRNSAGEIQNVGFVCVTMSTYQNAINLPANYIRTLKSSYSERLAEQELGGKFISLVAGTAYYTWSSNNIVSTSFKPQLETYLCWDFNTAPKKPLCCIVVQKEAGIYYAVKEFCYTATNTPEMCQRVDEYLRENKFFGDLTITGDYAGTANRSSATFSDYEHIERQFKNYRNFQKKILPTTRIKDRIEATNAALRNSEGKTMFYVDASCVALKRDFDQVVWKENGVGLDDSKPELTHPSDALSYLFYNLHPVHIKPTRSAIR